MHLLESYAVVSGALIEECFIQEDNIDLPSNKYITFHGYNPKGSGRQYKHWQQVLDLLQNNIKFNHTIIQIGGASDTKYNVNTDYLGKTSYNSLAYVIKNSDLHLGFDSLPAHLGSHYDKKMVILYAHYSNNTKPYFSTESNIILIEPDFSKIKPIFAQTDPFELINTIDPEIVYKSVLSLLNIS